jgi:hypothetical protein
MDRALCKTNSRLKFKGELNLTGVNAVTVNEMTAYQCVRELIFACMDRNMQPKFHRSATTYSVQNSISDTLLSITAISIARLPGLLRPSARLPGEPIGLPSRRSS